MLYFLLSFDLKTVWATATKGQVEKKRAQGLFFYIYTKETILLSSANG